MGRLTYIGLLNPAEFEKATNAKLGGSLQLNVTIETLKETTNSTVKVASTD